MKCSRCQIGELEEEEQQGMIVCYNCGHVEKGVLSNDTTFTKGPGGEATAVGQHVSDQAGTRGGGRIANGRLISYQRDSHDKSLSKGRHEVALLVDKLMIHPKTNTIDSAEALYKLALSRNFTRGRRTNQVAAACLYIICRQENKPFMLIDFSDQLQVNLYVLGAVWLQLCRLLCLEQSTMFTKPIDPSLYLHRFADRLLVEEEPSCRHAVANTALRMVASMKRDWMQTGRRPSGICGAALFIAAHIHGFDKSKRDVVAVVHIGQSTLSKRMDEFANTAAGALTVGEFEDAVRAGDAAQQQLLHEASSRNMLEWPAGGDVQQVGCSHTREEDPAMRQSCFAHGMCRACYEEYLTNSGGTVKGHDPPAYTNNVRKQMALEAAQADEPIDPFADQDNEAMLALLAPGDDDRDVEADMDCALVTSELGVVSQALPASVRAQAQKQARDRLKNPRMPSTPSPPPPGNATPPSTSNQPAQTPAEQKPAGKTRSAAKRRADTSAEALWQEQELTRAKQDASPVSHRKSARSRQKVDDEESGPADSESDGQADATEPHAGGGSDRQPQGDQQIVLYNGDEYAGGEEITRGAQPASQLHNSGDHVDDEILSDMSDDEADVYLHSKTEAAVKEQLWLAMNQEYVEKQKAKALTEAASEKASSAPEQQGADDAGNGQDPTQPSQQPRKRGRPLGSRTKVRPEDHMGPADTPQEAMKRFFKNKTYSSKINYPVLDGMFDSTQVPRRSPAPRPETERLDTGGVSQHDDDPVPARAASADARVAGKGYKPKAAAPRKAQARLGTLESF